MNPHSAVHYGSYAFKPMNALNSLDGGINNITGNVIKLEGHVQMKYCILKHLNPNRFPNLKNLNLHYFYSL